MPEAVPFAGRLVGEILNDIRAQMPRAENKRALGTRFEQLFRQVAPLVPDLEVARIWLWRDWPGLQKRGFTAQDIGIDLVAEQNDGTRVAIQCKCYAPEHRVGKDDVKDFIAAATPQIFPLRWFVATCQCTETAENLLRRNDIRFVDFLEHTHLRLEEEVQAERQPWPLQQKAISAVLQGFGNGHARGQLIMACGSGKTFVALRIAEALTPAKAGAKAPNPAVLFLAPSIALVAQARREWLRHSGRMLACTVICSDKGAGHPEDQSTQELACLVTTEPAAIAKALRRPLRPGAARAVFCTYQSLDKLMQAQHQHGAPKFDLALVDEAHRTTGYLAEDGAGKFQLIHAPENIRAARRLYMTATPRIYQQKEGKGAKDSPAEVVDMKDEGVYGPEFYRLTFKQAVDANMLCDYKVIALGINEPQMGAELKAQLLGLNDEIKGVGKKADDQAFLALGAIAKAVNGLVQGEGTPGVLARTIAYASNIRRSKWLASALQKGVLKTWLRPMNGAANALQSAITAEHLDGTSSALKRNAALRALNHEATAENPRLISNAQLFTEGVDVPALNAIAFLDPRRSKVDTIQAVGRVMRRDEASGKRLGYIIVPVILPPNADLIETLQKEQSRFNALGVVLRALQSHDERLYTDLTNRLTFADAGVPGEGETETPAAPREEYRPQELLDPNAKQAIYAKLVHKVGLGQPGKVFADDLTQAINAASQIFINEGITGLIAETIGTPAANETESCKVAALLLANACIMHKRLEETGHLGGLTGIGEVNRTMHPASALTAAWRTILRRDYAPVFEYATALLQKLEMRPHNESIQRALKLLISCAIRNATTLNELGFDHAGPLYHKVLGSAQSDGAFYTKNLSAYLLAGLAFGEGFCNWADADAVAKLKIVDPACGTGTLLMAALNVIKQRAAKAQNLGAAGIAKLHKQLVENTIYGFDINHHSIQLAACNLTIGAPNTEYARMNLHALQHGPVPGTAGARPGDVRHGVLEKLLQDDVGAMLIPPPPLQGENTLRETQDVTMPAKFDAVVNNPPFTDTSKAGTRFGDATVQAMRERLLSIKGELQQRDPDAADAISKQSIQPFFTPLNKALLQPAGTFANVIPATMVTAENARAQRQYIAANYHIETVVTSHDPKHPNLSENTSIHECLLIARRNANHDKPTRFIQLAKYPADVKEAEALLSAISAPPPPPHVVQRNAMAGRENARRRLDAGAMV